MSLLLYETVAGVVPSAGNEFKLLYGNREKIGKASGLAVWVFDDINIKTDNLVFSETLEDKQNGYVQNYAPMAGNEFKFLYGNREKVAEASSKSYFLFGSIQDREQISGIVLDEDKEGQCYFLNGGSGCVSTSNYIINSDIDPLKFAYEWKITSGDAELISDIGEAYATVRINEFDSDQTFSLQCYVINDMQSQSLVSGTFTHKKTGIATVSIDTFEETSNTSCFMEYPPEYMCEAQSSHSITIKSILYPTILWKITTTGSAYIKSGQGTTDVVISSKSKNISEDFTLEVTIDDGYSSDTASGLFTHTRSQRDPISIITMNETENNGCIYDPGQTCVATSTYFVDVSNNGLTPSYIWSIDNENVSIVSGQGTDTVIISTDSNVTISYNISVVVDDGFTQDSTSISAEHVKSERIPIEIISIDEVSSGSCLVVDGSTSCLATNTYEYTSGPVDYNLATILWAVTAGNASVVGQNNEQTVTIESNTGSDETFTLSLSIDDSFTSDQKSSQFTHTRENEVIITSLTETVAGSCSYDAGGTCIAESRYKIIAINTDTYTWSVSGPVTWEYVAGLTDEIIITSDSGTTDIFTVTCSASNSMSTKEISNNYSHVRNVSSIFSRQWTYDSSNITTEFIRKFANIIPQDLSSDNDRGFVSSSSTTYSNTTSSYRAFDNDTSYWQSALQDNPYWVKIMLPYPEPISKININNRDTDDSATVWSPDTVRVYGVNSDNTTEIISTVSGISDVQRAITTITLEKNTKEYSGYYIEIDNNESYCVIQYAELLKDI